MKPLRGADSDDNSSDGAKKNLQGDDSDDGRANYQANIAKSQRNFKEGAARAKSPSQPVFSKPDPKGWPDVVPKPTTPSKESSPPPDLERQRATMDKLRAEVKVFMAERRRKEAEDAANAAASSGQGSGSKSSSSEGALCSDSPATQSSVTMRTATGWGVPRPKACTTSRPTGCRAIHGVLGRPQAS